MFKVVYLLEKSRLTYQQPLERCYHAFYNLMSDEVKDLKVLEQGKKYLFTSFHYAGKMPFKR